jgi:hypothetical protein
LEENNCGANRLCIVDEKWEYLSMEEYIHENEKLKDSRNIDCAKNRLCLQKYKDYIIFKYESSIIYNDYTDGSGLALLVLD